MTSETYGFIPLSRLQQLSIASPVETCSFLLDVADVHSCMKSAREQDAVVLTRQLNERVFLFINVAFVHGKAEYYKKARQLAKDYKSYGLLPKVKSFKTILKIRSSQWVQDLQKVALIWRKSQVFADQLKEQLSPAEEALLNEQDLFLSCRLFLTASDAYHVCQKAMPLFEKWQNALKYDYGCIEVSKVRHLESFNSPGDNYAILLDSAPLPTKPATEQDFYQISRRIIALASASLLNKDGRGFITFADEILSKISSANKDIELSISYLKSVKAILVNFYSNWKEGWFHLKTDESHRLNISKFLKQHELTEAILDDSDLSTVANKYFLTLYIKKPRRRRSVSFEGSSEEEEEDSSNSLSSPRTSSSRPTSPVADSPRASNSPRISSSPRIKGEEPLQEWLAAYYPIILDKFLNQEFRGSLENFLKKNYENLFHDFKNNVTPALKECDDKLFDTYKKIVKNSEFSYLIFEYLLSKNAKVVQDFVQDKNYLSFLSFLFHEHHSYFAEFVNKSTESAKHNLLPQSEPPLGSRRKQTLYKLHVNTELKAFIIKVFLHFYHFNNEEEANSLFFQFCHNLEIRNKQKRDNFLRLFDVLEKIMNITKNNYLFSEKMFFYECFDFFAKNKLFVVREFLTDSEKYHFLTFLYDNYLIELKLYLMERELPLLSEVIQRPLKRKKLSQSEMIIEEFSNQAFNRTKQYIIFLHRISDEPKIFMRRFKEYLKDIRSSQKHFIVKKEIASQLKNNEINQVKIENSYYSIVDLSKKTLCNLCIKYAKNVKKDIIQTICVNKIIERSQGSILIQMSLASKLRMRNVQQIKVGTNRFNVNSFIESSVDILTVTPIEPKEDIQEIDIEWTTSNIPSVVEMMAALQSQELKSRTDMRKLLDGFREFAPDLFRR